MYQPGRKFSENSYKYGFNGKEKDDEVYSATGTSYDFGFRIYNPRLGRFLSVDPLFRSYPWFTPYQFAGNRPIWAIDLDGLEDVGTNTGEVRDPNVETAATPEPTSHTENNKSEGQVMPDLENDWAVY